MSADPAIKKHPAYSTGYWDGLDGLPLPEAASPEYRAGHENARESKAILLGAGFKQTGRQTFSKTTVLHPSQGERSE